MIISHERRAEHVRKRLIQLKRTKELRKKNNLEYVQNGNLITKVK